MKPSDIIGSIGVIILLIAFLLNLYKKIPATSKPYCLMNFLGAAICGYSSYLISFYPFVILETIWAGFALASFFKVPRGTSENEL
ncbi:MAG: hypothetical protein JWQ79_161 [Mucilaginibacter sp.]|jgi:hypothetical protein|nr:hypothetical protein [Mucilaginibacter sp.]